MTTPAQVGIWPRALALALAVFWGFFFYGLIDLLVFLQGPEFHASFHLETGWGLFFLFMVAAPLVAFAVAPSRAAPAAPQQLLLTAVAIVVGAALSVSPSHLLAAMGLAGTSWILAALTTGGTRAALARPRGWHWGLGIFAVAAAGPWFAYALTAADSARAGLHPTVTAELDHWPVQAALAIAIVLVAALAATLPTGWLIAACCAGVCSAWFGTVSWIYPDLDAGLGSTWGAAAAAWGVAFVAVALLTAARESTRQRRNAAPVTGEPGH